jgi:hypothetical protein
MIVNKVITEKKLFKDTLKEGLFGDEFETWTIKVKITWRIWVIMNMMKIFSKKFENRLLQDFILYLNSSS